MLEVKLFPLELSDREQFIRDNQDAFNYGVGAEDGEIISRDTIASAIDEGSAYRIVENGKILGGLVFKTEYDQGQLELLFVSPAFHGKGLGYAAWCELEAMHPGVTVWETVTPYFEKRNIHFYVNRCGFKIVEYYNDHHQAPGDKDGEMLDMFRFEKILPATKESIQEQIKRISYYEDVMQKAKGGSDEMLKKLSDYYGSSAWKRDFAADEAGLLPKNLARGVLSEDEVYNLLEEYGK